MAFHFDPKTHCQNLSCKDNYSSSPRDLEREARDRETGGTYETTAFWCLLTQTARGPDGERVNAQLCSGRSCAEVAGAGQAPSGRRRPCFIGLDDLT